ncbi:MAG: hypothetical protein U9R02_06045 [Thermodesulfobacteriota bacterium]|nr:hypothetical protein [Thermodesulfobacteriota bacterium]
MAQVNLFLLLPETNPVNKWMRSTETEFYEVNLYEKLIRDLKTRFEDISIENYEGFYDNLNIKNFLCCYEILEDCYPSAPKKLLQSLIQNNAFINWRDDPIQSNITEYKIFSQQISNNTFCEIAQRKSNDTENEDNYVLLNHNACSIQKAILVTINNVSGIEIDNLKYETELLTWFAENRLPQRNFNINPKHGENRQEITNVGGEDISPLRSSCEEAQILLHTAIGNHKKELFNLDYDHDEIIVFKFEGDTPQNMYHGYHVPKDSVEVPGDIRKKLNQ